MELTWGKSLRVSTKEIKEKDPALAMGKSKLKCLSSGMLFELYLLRMCLTGVAEIDDKA